MKIFLDTANLDEIKEANSLGIVDGITTNPTLIAREGKDFETTIKAICEVVDGPVNAETTSLDAEGIIAEGEKLAKWAPNVVVKVPMCREGLKAIKALSDKNIKCNMTLIFSPNQALLAAKAGAAFISPFVGRLDDISSYGTDMVSQIAEIYEIHGIDTEIICASIRNPLHVIDAAEAGADIATIPAKVIDQMIEHPLTTAGIDRFLEDWKKVQEQA